MNENKLGRFIDIQDSLVLDKEVALELYNLLRYQYISYTKYLLIHKLINDIVKKYPECLS